MKDPRDTGVPIRKEWEEFRASFASTLLNLWLLKDIEDLVPDYPKDLQNRLESARDIVDASFDGDDSSGYPIPSIAGDNHDHEWWDKEAYDNLWDQLFPFGTEDPKGEFEATSRRLIAVGLHAALEQFCRASGVHERGALPKSIVGWFRSRGRAELLSADLMDKIRDLDATRHIAVHNRGLVDEKYIKNVAESELVRGEPRPLEIWDVQVWGNAVWNLARLITATRLTEEERTGP